MRILNKEQWLTEMPKLIYKLRYKYEFYFSGHYSIIKKDILEIVNKSKHRHKIVLYTQNGRFYLVVYRKGSPDIYITNEYRHDTNYNRISYFLRKFKKSYEKAEAEYEQGLFTDQVVDTSRI